MRYLLDTCVISDFIKGETETTVRLKQTSPVDVAISTVTVMELRYGLALNPQRAQKIEPAIVSIVSSVTILPFCHSALRKLNNLLKSVLLSNLKGSPLVLMMF